MDSEDVTVPDAAAAPEASAKLAAATPGWVVFSILTFTGLGFAFAVFTAIAFLATAAGSSAGLSAYGWALLIFAAIFPLLVLALVYAIARKRSALELFATALAGLGLSGVLWLNVLGHILTSPLMFIP
jgi:hypothetical protein